MTEIWKPIKDYPNYFVSSQGNIRNIKRNKILNPIKTKKGYFRVGLYNGSRTQPKYFSVSRLVASYFIENLYGKPEVNHIDGNKGNNSASNLEWSTSQENQIHAYRKKLQTPMRGSKHFAAKIKERDILKIKELWFHSGKNKECKIVKNSLCQKDIAEKFGINQQNVSLIVRGKAWRHTLQQGG